MGRAVDKKEPPFRNGKGAAQSLRAVNLIDLLAGILSAGDEAQFWRKFQITSAGVGGLPEMLRIWLAVSAFVSGEREGHQFKNTKPEARNGLAGAMEDSIAAGGGATFFAVGLVPLGRYFRHTINDVGERAAQFADGAVLLRRGGLEVCHAQAGDADGQEDKDGFFHKKSQCIQSRGGQDSLATCNFGFFSAMQLKTGN